MSWDPIRDIKDMSGKVAIVTGGNSGIGKEMVRHLALHNARVYMASRTESKAQEVIEQYKKEHPGLEKRDSLKFLKLDLCSLKGSRDAAMNFLAMEDRLDILINNAGIMAAPYELTADGVEIQFQSNHLGHFAFTMPLLPLLIKTSKEPASSVRVIQISSSVHKLAPRNVKFDSLDSVSRKSFGPMDRYAQTKLANIYFAKELARRLKDERIWSNSVHPGAVHTGITYAAQQTYLWLKPILFVLNRMLKTPSEGAKAPLYVACSEEIEKNDWRGEYFVPMTKRGRITRQARNDQMAKDLWELSERVIEEKIGKLPRGAALSA